MSSPQKIVVFDTETDGVDTETCHIVTAFIGLMDAAGNLVEKHDWLIDFGGEIPSGASDVHGITTEKMRAEGRKDAGVAVREIADILNLYGRHPVVIYNATYDLTLLDQELRRHGHAPLEVPAVVIDPLVLDKGIDKYRKGSRKLGDVAKHYGVEVPDNLHDAAIDCEVAGRLAYAILQHPRLRNMSLAAIHKKTIPTKREQAAGLQAYFRKQQAADPTRADEPPTVIRGDWPIIPLNETKEVAA